MTAMVQPLRKLIDMKKYKDSKKLNLTDESIAAFHFFRQAVSYCQELYFLEDTATPILQTDAYWWIPIQDHQSPTENRSIFQ